MSFYKFIITFMEDDTPFGQLAEYIIKDNNFPKEETNTEHIFEYVHENYYEHHLLESANRALSVYKSN
ncbi:MULTISPECIES: YozE family protein [Staphylococcus]|uniref:YozE family protein n=1 Tax=Staphylococcus TaxID=1279 RepID=UPI000DF81FD2|nr:MULTISPECIES: YozE family protein [unclassified Staphylococcus]UXV34552.1 sterile alpha motif-like domain-containing protein [Staphylococcus sp. IVB6181]